MQDKRSVISLCAIIIIIIIRVLVLWILILFGMQLRILPIPKLINLPARMLLCPVKLNSRLHLPRRPLQ